MLLEAIDLKKSYRNGEVETAVLKGVSLSIHETECLAITGASGAGKSTLLHILGSLDRPTDGQVLFKGNDLYGASDEEISGLRNREIGFVFQFHHLLPELTALENVTLPLLIRGVSRREAGTKARDLLGRLGIKSQSDRRPADLSGGEQQRVAVARAMVGSPSILFADEPTGNLDHENGEKLIQELLELHRSRGTALVFVTHNEPLASAFPERCVMEDGRIKRLK